MDVTAATRGSGALRVNIYTNIFVGDILWHTSNL